MTTFTASVLAEFKKNIDTGLEYGLADIKSILSNAYKTVKEANAPAKTKNGPTKPRKERKQRVRDDDGNIVKLRAPSAYNIFVGEKSKEIRAENPGINTKDAFKAAVALWNKSKSNKASDDNSDDNKPLEKEIEDEEEKIEDEEEKIEDEEEKIEVKKTKKTAKAKKTVKKPVDAVEE